MIGRCLRSLTPATGGEHGKRLMDRRFHKQVWATPELPSAQELIQFRRVMEELADLQPYETDSTKAWYAAGADKELLVEAENDEEEAVQLSRCSNLIGGLRKSERHRLFVPEERRDEANDRLRHFPLKKASGRRRQKIPSHENVAA
jgi:hypothetical protein